ncbi:hypothetical protein HY382_01300 [Candidatus Curtissbacteria bacterium]|nr:hypothetical protein [Candidatus Curtissbacteria bacterium]
MISIAVPANMETTLEHLKLSGRPVTFADRRDDGIVETTGDQVIRLRSYDIPLVVGFSANIGLCGSDMVAERQMQFVKRHEILSEYIYGRQFKSNQPTLDLVAPQNERIKTVREIEPGSIIATEYPNLTRSLLEDNDMKTDLFLDSQTTPDDLKEFITGCKDEGLVGMVIVHGRVPAVMHHLNGYGVYGVLVNESGKTLKDNNLKILERIHRITTQLIVDPDALKSEIAEEIEGLRKNLDETYIMRIKESEGPRQKERF